MTLPLSEHRAATWKMLVRLLRWQQLPRIREANLQRLRERVIRRTRLGAQDCRRNQLDWRVIVLPHDRTPKHLLWPGNTAQHLVASSDRVRKELGYRDWLARDEGIRRTIAWERANPPAAPTAQFDYEAEDAALAQFKATA